MFEQAVWYDFNEHFPPLQILSYMYKKFVKVWVHTLKPLCADGEREVHYALLQVSQ